MWYRTGTVSITNGSATVTGAGTNWIDQHAGWIMVTEASTALLEVKRVISSTEIELVQPVGDATESGLTYFIIPTHSLNVDLLDSIDAMIVEFASSRDAWQAVYSDFSSTVYQLWLDEGNSGTVADFLAAITGPQGAKGDQGDSAYQVWLSEGNTGTEADFLNDLSAGAISAAQAAQAAAETAQGSAEVAQAGAETAETGAQAAEAKAQDWAEKAEDVEVEIGLYSALHHAAKAQVAETGAVAAQGAAAAAQAAAETAQGLAEVAQAGAETAETGAQTAEAKAQDWAEKAEDAEVEAGKYSALHHSAKAQVAQAAAEVARGASETAQGAAEAAQIAAAGSASAASASAGSAATAEAGAMSALDNFTDIYLGPKASDPTVDNDGDPLANGMLYSNTTSDVMKVYLGGQWRAAYADLSGALIASANLSDLTDASAAIGNLGLGTAALSASGDFATAAQGAKADSAVQPGDLGTAAPLNVPASGDAAAGEVVKGNDGRLTDARTPTSHTHTKSEISDFSDGDYATAAQGALADSAVQPSDLSAALRYVLKSGTYTAAPGERIAADVSGGAWVLSLPAAPSAGDGVMISVVSGDVTVNNLTIAGNGNTVQGDATLVVDVALATVPLVYNGTEWRIA